jgi:two-component system chemotaxis response regulator CheY
MMPPSPTTPHPDLVIIEDDNDVREAIEEVLNEEGYVTRSFAAGDDALLALQAMTTLPKLILLDLMMPKMNGWQFRELQRGLPEVLGIPTVILSADSNVTQNLHTLGAEGYLRKPIHIQTLLELVERFCGPKHA